MGDKQERIVRRNDRKNLIKDPTSDQLSDGYDEARKLVVLHEDPRNRRGYKEHELLPGVTKTSGDMIQGIVGQRLQGFRDVDAAEHLGTSQPNISRLEKNHPDAFAKAEVHLLQQAERKYLVNLWGVRSALSEAGPRMVKVLVDLAEDASLKENVRRSAATDVLNLAGVGYSRQSVGGKDGGITRGAANVFIQNIVDKEKEYAETVVVEAEDAEVIE